MTERSLQVTYRKGRPFAAYLHLSHVARAKSVRTVASSDGSLIVGYGSSGCAVGVEITTPRAVILERLNALLGELGECPLAQQEYEPRSSGVIRFEYRGPETFRRAMGARMRSTVLAAALAASYLCASAGPGLLAQAAAPSSPVKDVTAASAHVDEILDVLEANWFRRKTMDWRTFRASVLAAARDARTIQDSYAAIRVALHLLGDRHSYYIPAEGPPIFNPDSPSQSTGECDASDPSVPTLPASVGYIRVKIPDAKAGADDIRRSIAATQGPTPDKWIVDLRNSRGGNMWPILAAIGPILGEGVAGYFADGDGELQPWGYNKRGAELNGRVLAVNEAAPPSFDPLPRVALLTDTGVVSSGEAIAIAFRGRPNTRSFGAATCGLTTGVSQIPLQTGGRIAVVNSVMVDRLKTRYGGKIVPDEQALDGADALRRALEWLSR